MADEGLYFHCKKIMGFLLSERFVAACIGKRAMARQTFGDNVRHYRTLRGLGQEELAQRIGKSVPTISRIENGSKGSTLQRSLPLLLPLIWKSKN